MARRRKTIKLSMKSAYFLEELLWREVLLYGRFLDSCDWSTMEMSKLPFPKECPACGSVFITRTLMGHGPGRPDENSVQCGDCRHKFGRVCDFEEERGIVGVGDEFSP